MRRSLMGGLVLALGLAGAAEAKSFSSRYDHDIQAATAKWWPRGPDWRTWKAQLYQESRLDPAAVSPVGAKGLAQFMPGTWAGVARELRLPPGASATHDIAIDAGAYYMAKLSKAWSAPRPAVDRHQLAQASYNAGLGNLIAAQRRCGGKSGYGEISACLPQVTGARNARETLGYVVSIAKWRALMEAGL